MKLLVLEKAFNGRLRSVPVFPNSNIGCFFDLVHVHLTILLSDIPLDCIKAWFRSVPVFPHSNIGYFQFSSCSFLRPIFHISDEVFGLFPIFLNRFCLGFLGIAYIHSGFFILTFCNVCHFPVSPCFLSSQVRH